LTAIKSSAARLARESPFLPTFDDARHAMSAKSTPSSTVLAAIRHVLLPHEPFSSMSAGDLDRIGRAAKLRYFAPGEVILSPGNERPSHCFIVRQGVVRGERPNASGDPTALWELDAGDMFPLGALLATRGVSSIYRSLEDTFVLAFPAEVFDKLIAVSAPFQDFCTRRLAHLLDISRARFQAEYASAVTEQRGLATPLGALVRNEPITVAPTTPLAAALQLMEDRRIGSLPVVDDARRPAGIFTRQDVIGRIVLPGVGLGEPISAVMTVPVITLPMHATAGDAAVAMARRGIRHVVLVDGAGAVAGVVSERDLFGLQRLSVRELASSIRRARDLQALVQCAADVRALSYALVAQGVASGQLTRMISSLNDQLVARLLDVTAPRHDLSGVTLCWIGMGSEGRSEQTIATDQDNGLIFVPNDPGAAPDAIRERLLPFAREVNEGLDALGYPLCKGGVMAMNPKWCASLDEWRAAFFGWIDRGDPQSLLEANIFFDFRTLWGEAGIAEALRVDIAGRAKGNPRFLKQMSDNALTVRPPLNWMGEIAAKEDDRGVAGIDLKASGTAAFVDAARILALASGVTATNTVERMQAASAAKGIAEAEVNAWADAFEYLQFLRLRTQHRRASALLPASGNPNLVPLDDLSELDRRILKEALRQCRKLQQRLEVDYPG
jgi:CBS domain-containing protein